jgi:hypothetical protein
MANGAKQLLAVAAAAEKLTKQEDGSTEDGSTPPAAKKPKTEHP